MQKPIKENGYAFDKEEFSVGLTCVAAHIFDSAEKAKNAISVLGPTVRMTEEKVWESIEVIRRAVEDCVKEFNTFVPGYKILLEPIIQNDIVNNQINKLSAIRKFCCRIMKI